MVFLIATSCSSLLIETIHDIVFSFLDRFFVIGSLVEVGHQHFSNL